MNWCWLKWSTSSFNRNPKSVFRRIKIILFNKSTFNQTGWFLWECGCKEDNKNQSQESSLATHSKNVPRIINHLIANCQNEHYKRKHSGKGHKFAEIFNENNIKVSYSCMDSMKKIVNNVYICISYCSFRGNIFWVSHFTEFFYKHAGKWSNWKI